MLFLKIIEKLIWIEAEHMEKHVECDLTKLTPDWIGLGVRNERKRGALYLLNHKAVTKHCIKEEVWTSCNWMAMLWKDIIHSFIQGDWMHMCMTERIK